MKLLRLKGNNPYYNLAYEEYLFTQVKEDCILIWQNDNSIIVGKHQNTGMEVNLEKAAQHGCRIVRRITGGGTVFHDLGNINFSCIYETGGTESKGGTFLKHLLDFLSSQGVNAALSGKNDILAGERKISGSAGLQRGSRMLFHGTLLYSSDLARMEEVLKVSEDKLASKGIRSVRSRVANLSEMLPEPVGTDEFIEELVRFFEGMYGTGLTELQPEGEAAVNELVRHKYETWNWNYGLNPECNYHNRRRFEAGEIEVKLLIEKHKITGCKIRGDFIDSHPVEQLEEKLVGAVYNREVLLNVLKGINLLDYLGKVSQEDFLALLI